MTHFHANLRLPVRTGPSPMEDAIVQQVEWYMGRRNLERDEYLKNQMDDDLWVSLDIILDFPKMKAMQVTDKNRVATLLHARSTVVEVDEKTSRIRPAWARRSTVVIHDVPPNARLDQVAALFHIPSPTADLSKTAIPPPTSHPAGLISIQPATETVWLAIFDSPTGASTVLPLLMGKSVNGQKITAEVHIEPSLRPQLDSFHRNQTQPGAYPSTRSSQGDGAPNSTSFTSVNPIMSGPMVNNQMLNPMGIPMPVIHHPSHEIHPSQYPYAPPTAYVAHSYAPQGVGVPRQFIGAPRAVPGYVLAYPQQGHPFDGAHHVSSPSHSVGVSQPVDQPGAPGIVSSAASGESSSSPATPVVPGMDAIGNGSVSQSGLIEASKALEASSDFVESGLAQAQADAQSMAGQMPFTGSVQVAMIPGQTIDSQMMAMSLRDQSKGESPYVQRGGLAPDGSVNGFYVRGNLRQHQGSMGRDRNGLRNASDGSFRIAGRGSAGGSMDGQGRGPSGGRKGKKSRNGNSRHGHGHGQQDRHVDGRSRDGRGDGSGSDSGDRRGGREDKSKPEPNLASMHFPPLPMSDSGGSRSNSLKTTEKDRKVAKTTGADAAKESLNGAIADVKGSAETPVGSHDASADNLPCESTAADSKEADMAEASGAKSVGLMTGEKEARCSKEPAGDESPSVESPAPVEKTLSDIKPAVVPSGGSMSYAAILRSKKPVRVPAPNARGPSNSKAGDSSLSAEHAGTGSVAPSKDKTGRRRKGSGSRSGPSGDANREGSSPGVGGSGHEKTGGKESLSNATGPGIDGMGKQGTEGGLKAKHIPDSTRAHPVWVNKPKSLFEAASAVPSVRPSTPQTNVDSRKVTSPVSSLEGDKDPASEAVPRTSLRRSSSSGNNSDLKTEYTSQGDVNMQVIKNDGIAKEMNGLKSGRVGGGEGDAMRSRKAREQGTSQTSAKGAWASGGPKPWPKSNHGKAVEKVSGISDSLNLDELA